LLVIRNEQLSILGRVPRNAFEAELARHFTRHYPAECRRAGSDQVIKMVRLGIQRAFVHGYTTQREIGLYVNLMVILGSAFDCDPQIPWALEQLNDLSIDDPFDRIRRTFQSTVRYLEQCFGAENGQMARTLVRLRDFDLKSAPQSEGLDFQDALGGVLRYFCPHKCDVQGEEANRALVREGLDRAEEYGIESSRGLTVYITLMFLLGAGFDQDPMYPWAGQVLRDRSLRDEKTRVAALHEAAMRYVAEVLSE
jgi:hypothetical protein